MNSREFKKKFDETAKKNGFEGGFGGWFKESKESIIVLDLQKSNFGDYYEMNIKIYIQGMFGNSYAISKNLVKRDVGNIFRRQPSEYKSVFDFDKPMEDDYRMCQLEKLFREFIVPFAEKALSKSGIKELACKGDVSLLPAIKDGLI